MLLLEDAYQLFLFENPFIPDESWNTDEDYLCVEHTEALVDTEHGCTAPAPADRPHCLSTSRPASATALCHVHCCVLFFVNHSHN